MFPHILVALQLHVLLKIADRMNIPEAVIPTEPRTARVADQAQELALLLVERILGCQASSAASGIEMQQRGRVKRHLAGHGVRSVRC